MASMVWCFVHCLRFPVLDHRLLCCICWWHCYCAHLHQCFCHHHHCKAGPSEDFETWLFSALTQKIEKLQLELGLPQYVDEAASKREVAILCFLHCILLISSAISMLKLSLPGGYRLDPARSSGTSMK